MLGHSGDSSDVDHLSALADEGFILGMDRFGLNVETTFEARADTVVELCRRGYADRMVLSHDAACYIDWIDPNVMALMTQWNYLHIHDEVLPYLREHGVTDAQIDTMLVETPRRYFEEHRLLNHSRGLGSPLGGRTVGTAPDMVRLRT